MNNEQLTEHLYEIGTSLSALVEKAEAIHSEVKRTNGRVTKLEELNASLAKLVSHHSGEFVRKTEEFKLLRELVANKEEAFRAVIAEWEERRDAKYEEERANRKEWMDHLWQLLKWLIPLGVAATLATFGIEALPIVPGV